MTNTHTIRTFQLSSVVDRVAKLNKKAVKLGLASIIEVVAGKRTVETNDKGKVTKDETEVTFLGEAPKVDGHEMLATIRHLPGGDMIHQGSNGLDFSDYVNKGSFCDHCNTKRKRNETFILRTPEGATIRVGRNCLADFIRSNDAAVFVLWSLTLEMIDSFFYGGENEEGWDGSCGGGGRVWLGTASYLANALRSVRKDGFKKADKGSESTRAAVDCWFGLAHGITPLTPAERKFVETRTATEQDEIDAKEMVSSWAANMEVKNDFLNNVKVACLCPVVERTEGILCAAAMVFSRERDEQEEKEEKAPRISEHFGEVGTRYELALTVVRTITFETTYGEKSIITMLDENGRTIVWKGTSDMAHSLEKGDTVEGKGTVKDHDEWKGLKQTNVTRCKFTRTAA